MGSEVCRVLVVDDSRAIHGDFDKILRSQDERSSRARLSALSSELFGDTAVSAPPARTCIVDLLHAHQGEEALSVVRAGLESERPVHVVFVDGRMPPGIDGIETAARLWALDERLEIVLCTAYSDYSLEQIHERLGARPNLLILKKPFEPIEVRQFVSALSRKWRLAEENRAHLEKLEKVHEAERLQSLGRLAAGVAHDFNNLLTVISGNVELLQLAHPHEPLLSAVQSSARHAADLTEQLMMFTRSGMSVPATMAPAVELERVLNMMGRTFKPGIAVDIQVDEPAWMVFVALTDFRRIVVNLVTNACEAMAGEGRLTLTVSNSPAAAGGVDSVWLEVRDTGCGMTDQVRRKAIEPFYSTKGDPGVGLGLSVVSGLVRSSRGELIIDSEEGQGTTIRVQWPRRGAEVVPRAESSTDSVTTRAHKPLPRRVLVVDDDAMVGGLTARILEAAGYRTVVATSGEAALSTLASDEDRVALVITDVVMPGMDGKILQSRIRSMYPELPVVFMSAYTPADAQLRDLHVDDDLFIPKPWTAQRLLSVVSRMLSTVEQGKA